MLPALDEAVGASSTQASVQFVKWDGKNRRRVSGLTTTNACFMARGEITSRGFPVGMGHGCYNALAQRIGYARVTHCWPRECRLATSECRNIASPHSRNCRESCRRCQASQHNRHCLRVNNGQSNRTEATAELEAQRLFGISSAWYQCCKHHGVACKTDQETGCFRES